MPEPLEPALGRIRDLLLDPERLVRAVAAGRRRGTAPPWRKVELRYVDVRAGRRLQVTRYDATQAHTSNLDDAQAVEVVDELLAEPFGNWHLDDTEQTTQLRVTKKGEAQVHVTSARSPGANVDRSHDRTKPRLLDPADPFWQALGISDGQGQVKPTRKSKQRQVEEFVKHLGEALDDAFAGGQLRQPTAEEPLRVVDLGCGNAYLTFAAYRYLAGVRRLPVTLTGVDVRAAARARNIELAERLGWQQAMRFVAGTIAAEPAADDGVPEHPDVVLALHACDTATDDALAHAVRRGTPLVLAAPCCHHDLQRQLKGRQPPAPYALLARHGILREKLADVLTDALRAAVLRVVGYRVDVVEFVDSAHTPRNLLLRAVRTDAAASSGVVEEYHQLTQQWGLRPALADALGPVFSQSMHATATGAGVAARGGADPAVQTT